MKSAYEEVASYPIASCDGPDPASAFFDDHEFTVASSDDFGCAPAEACHPSF